MGLDIRLPIGMMFTLIGLMLAVQGFLTSGDKAMYHRSLDININFVWGVALLIFGLGMLLASLLTKKQENQPAEKAKAVEKTSV